MFFTICALLFIVFALLSDFVGSSTANTDESGRTSVDIGHDTTSNAASGSVALATGAVFFNEPFFSQNMTLLTFLFTEIGPSGPKVNASSSKEQLLETADRKVIFLFCGRKGDLGNLKISKPKRYEERVFCRQTFFASGLLAW